MSIFEEAKKIIKDNVDSSLLGGLFAVGKESDVSNPDTRTDITVYGATSFVAQHVLNYLLLWALNSDGSLKITLAGRNETRIQKVLDAVLIKLESLSTIYSESTGKCFFDTFIAESNEEEKLKQMATRTKVVLNCAGPFSKYSSNVVAACASSGTDYVDITGEVSWASKMRLDHSETAKKSGARVISFCGFDSVPSDLAVFAAVRALRKSRNDRTVQIEKATTWHHIVGMVNGGTIATAAEMPLELEKTLLRRPVPFLLDDPLALTNPNVRNNPEYEATKNRLAASEWWNQMINFDSIFRMGASIPFFMAPINAKVVHASAISLKYGDRFTYKERFLPIGYAFTTQLGIISLIPAVITQVGLLLLAVLLRLPVIGPRLVSAVAPPGSGPPEAVCKAGVTEVYAEVCTRPDTSGRVDKANCYVAFEGDPGNYVTAQCVCEAALALIFDRDKLPPKSEDGFGTPAELLGEIYLERLIENEIRPVEFQTDIRHAALKHEWRMYPARINMRGNLRSG